MTYNNYYFNENRTPTSTGVVVLYREEKTKKSLKTPFIASLACIFILSLTLQLSFINSTVFGESPITSPLTAPITSPVISPSPSLSPSPSPSASPYVAPSSNSSPTPSVSPSSNNQSSSSSNGGSNETSAPSCNDQKPNSAPTLLAATYTGPNQITLNWSKAKDPVSYYLVAYGTNSQANQYGNPNIGDKNTTSYAVKDLSGNTNYYFKVRAGNNCMPGEFSNVILAKTTGRFKATPALGFSSGVLSANVSPKPVILPNQVINQISNQTSFQQFIQQFINKVFSFFQR